MEGVVVKSTVDVHSLLGRGACEEDRKVHSMRFGKARGEVQDRSDVWE